MHVDDLASACVYLLGEYDGSEPINIGSGQEVSIAELATIIKSVVGFTGEIEFDRTKPDGTPRKLLSSDKLQNLGWQASVDLKTGIEDTYQWFLKNEVQSNNTKIA